MKWLGFLGMDRRFREPAPMTPETAEPILDIVAEALQQDDGLPYYPLSSLQGHDVFQIDIVLKLRIANDFLLLALNGEEAKLGERAMQWESIPYHVATEFVSDDIRNKLRSFPRESKEFLKVEMEMMPSISNANGKMDPKYASLETLSSFAKFCRYVGTGDPLYWQKIYTRLGLPYEKRCPQGNDPVFTE